jgi:intracellular septation protein A
MKTKMEKRLKKAIVENVVMYIQILFGFFAISVIGGGVMTSMVMIRDHIDSELHPMNEYISDFSIIFGTFFTMGLVYSTYLVWRNIRTFLRLRDYDQKKHRSKL